MAAVKDAGISKIAAVKKAMKELGKDAMPGAIQEYVKDKFGVVMSTSHVSNYKTHLRKKKSKKAAAAKAENTLALAAPAVKAASAPANRSSVTLSDVAAVKELVGRVGEDKLKSLIGILG